MNVLSLRLDQGARLSQGKGSGRLVDTATLRQAVDGSGVPGHG